MANVSKSCTVIHCKALGDTGSLGDRAWKGFGGALGARIEHFGYTGPNTRHGLRGGRFIGFGGEN